MFTRGYHVVFTMSLMIFREIYEIYHVFTRGYIHKCHFIQRPSRLSPGRFQSRDTRSAGYKNQREGAAMRQTSTEMSVFFNGSNNGENIDQNLMVHNDEHCLFTELLVQCNFPFQSISYLAFCLTFAEFCRSYTHVI